MATQEQIGSTYDYMDRIWRLSLGEDDDITAALFDGDFSKSLKQAQRDKHDFILRELRFEPGWRVLDIGCGWGALLRTLLDRGGKPLGWTLSEAQLRACRSKGLPVQLCDWRSVNPAAYGVFDAIASVGALEHFCSPEEYEAGQQVRIYQAFFECCHGMLPAGRRLYLQMMTWGARVPRPADIALDAPRDSDERVLAFLSVFYPGSWLPVSLEQITATAAPYFHVASVKNGRLDYIETIDRWNRQLRRISLRKAAAVLSLIPRFMADKQFAIKIYSLLRSCNQECFKRGLMDHYRVVLESRKRTSLQHPVLAG